MMDLQTIVEFTWIPLLAFALSFLAGLHMLLIRTRPPYMKNRSDKRPLKNEEMYAVTGGKLLLFFALGAAGMTGLLFLNIYAAFAEIIVVFLVFSVMWRNMSMKYGPF